MLEKATGRTEWKHGVIVTGIGVLLLAMGSCVGGAQKPAPTVTPDQVRSNADKGFEKLKQEEKNRAVDSGVGPY